MSRPRQNDPRHHQLNIRFTAREFAKVHHYAGLLGKTPTDFARTLMLRRPRTCKRDAPAIISLPERILHRWHVQGLTLNNLAHRFNATDELPVCDLPSIIRAFRVLLRCSFRHCFEPHAELVAYALAPAVRYHLRKTCTNLVQIADRYRALKLLPPLPLSNLIGRFRIILNADRPVHGP